MPEQYFQDFIFSLEVLFSEVFVRTDEYFGFF